VGVARPPSGVPLTAAGVTMIDQCPKCELKVRPRLVVS
jgi:hypothetical protein